MVEHNDPKVTQVCWMLRGLFWKKVNNRYIKIGTLCVHA